VSSLKIKFNALMRFRNMDSNHQHSFQDNQMPRSLEADKQGIVHSKCGVYSMHIGT